jgi:serine O-acetyltransferase
MLDNLKRDTRRLREIKTKRFPFYVVESLLFENGYQAVVAYRIASWFKHRRIPFFGPLFARTGLFCTGVDISPGAVIGPGLRISHGTGIVIGNGVRIGADAVLLHQVTLGAASDRRISEMPTVGDRVFIGAGAKLIGGVTIGDDVFIGVDAVVTADVPSNSKVTCAAGVEVVTETARG